MSTHSLQPLFLRARAGSHAEVQRHCRASQGHTTRWKAGGLQLLPTLSMPMAIKAELTGQ